MTRETVSIAMATYNGGRFIGAQLASLARQTELPAELVVSDDGSDDDTLPQVEAFAAVAPFPVRIHRNGSRLGYADNFLRAASLCSGSVVAFSDQDDIWLEQKLARLAPAFADTKVMLVIHAGEVVDEALRPAGWRFPRIQADRVVGPLHGHWRRGFPGFSLAFRARLPLLHRRPRPWSAQDRHEPMIHDQWICFLADIFGRVAYLAEPLVLYRRHGATATRPAPDTLVDGLLRPLGVSSESYAATARLDESWSAWLEEAAPTLPEGDRLLARAGAVLYRARSRHLERRAALYRPGGNILSRFGTWARMVARGAYGRHQDGGLGTRALAKDCSVGLLGLGRGA